MCKEGGNMNSFISWIGGKKLLRERIIQEFPESSYQKYIEVFGGAGWVLFARERHAEIEIYNDIDSNLINLYRCVKYHPEALQKELDGVMMSRELFLNALQSVEGLTDIQRAARFFIVIKESFGADRRSFGANIRDLKKATDFLSMASKRLKSVIVEKKDFESLIKGYDGEKSFFYLDPPYYKSEKYYETQFLLEDHIRLKEILDRIDGKFLLSYNDCEQVRELYSKYRIVEVEREHNFLTKEGGKQYKELLIKNY